MSANEPLTLAVSKTMANPTASFLQLASVEVTGKQIDKVPLLQNALPQGAKIFIALIDPSHVDAQVEMAKALRGAGFEPIPHVPARFVLNPDDLNDRVGRLVDAAGVTNILALGGGAPEPLGQYHCAIQLMETGAFQKHGIKTIGIAGHPEGNPDITKTHGEAELLRTLSEKNAWIRENRMQGYIATQFLFDAVPLAHWARELRINRIDLPLHIGVPGPASIKTLVKYAAMCGVGNSARFIRKQALNITKLLTVSEPTELVQQLATLHFDRPELGIAAPHLYPFGGFDKLLDWMKTQKT